MEFVPTPSSHTPQGYLPHFWSTYNQGPNIRTLVLPMLTWSPFPSILVFQMSSVCCNSSSNSVMITRSSACRFSQGRPWRLRRGILEPWRAIRAQGRALVNAHFHPELFTQVAPTTHHDQRQAYQEPTRWHVWIHDWILFQIDKGHEQCLLDGIILFLATGMQWIWRL